MASELTTVPEPVPSAASTVPEPAPPDDALLVERVRRLLVERVHLDVASPDVDLVDAGLLDSLALVEVLLVIEQELGVEVPLDELEVADLRTVRSIARLVGAPSGTPGP